MNAVLGTWTRIQSNSIFNSTNGGYAGSIDIKSVTESKTFCPAPWTTLRLGTNGATGICPYSENVGNYLTDKVDDILKNSLINSVKTSMLNEEWHEHCNYCKNSEQHGGRSERLLYIDNLNQKTKTYIGNNFDQNVLVSCSINWNNLCNLACVYCNPDSSSEWQRVKGKIVEISRLDEENAVDYLITNQEHLKQITIGGGEPLLQKSIYKLLDNLHNEVFIHVTTNLSVKLENNPMFNRIIQNKNLKVNWMISFDCLEDRFEYVRHGADWTVFCDNIDLLKKYNQKVTAHPAYCLYSAFDLVNYYDFCVDRNLELFWCDLFSPHELDIRFAPSSIRSKAIEEINQVLDKYNGNQNLAIETLYKYREMCYNGVPISKWVNHMEFSNQQRAKDILSFIKSKEQELDKRTKFKELWPNIFNELKETCYE